MLSARAAACALGTSAAQERCVLDALLGDGGLAAAPDRSPPATSTVTLALADGSGTCAALAASVLALTESAAIFEALVFREHVVLVSRARPESAFELLQAGRPLDTADLERFSRRTPGGPVRVEGADFVPYYLDNLAARLAEAGRTDEAERAFRRALELAPEAPRILYNYGSFLVRERRFAEGVGPLDEAIRRGWHDADAYVNYGVALWQLGRIDEARAAFARALALEPDHREAALNLDRIAAPAAHP